MLTKQNLVDAVKCSECGAPSPSDLSRETGRLACPQCGGTAFIIEASITETVQFSDRVSGELVPGIQARDWELRWTLLQDELAQILRPHTEMMSGQSIHLAAQRLFSFFIHAYHLKDALKRFIGDEIEDVVTKDQTLSLLADVANLDKHTSLDRRTRSDAVPCTIKISGEDLPAVGWRLIVQIEHQGRVLDGLCLAKDVMKTWRGKLESWEQEGRF